MVFLCPIPFFLFLCVILLYLPLDLLFQRDLVSYKDIAFNRSYCWAVGSGTALCFGGHIKEGPIKPDFKGESVLLPVLTVC